MQLPIDRVRSGAECLLLIQSRRDAHAGRVVGLHSASLAKTQAQRRSGDRWLHFQARSTAARTATLLPAPKLGMHRQREVPGIPWERRVPAAQWDTEASQALQSIPTAYFLQRAPGDHSISGQGGAGRWEGTRLAFFPLPPPLSGQGAAQRSRGTGAGVEKPSPGGNRLCTEARI